MHRFEIINNTEMALLIPLSSDGAGEIAELKRTNISLKCVSNSILGGFSICFRPNETDKWRSVKEDKFVA
jgi:hypothetical protein